MLESEQWAPIPSLPGYQASDKGRICGPKGIRSLYMETTTGGYSRMRLGVRGPGRGYRTLMVHHLILEAFGHPRPPGSICRHLNGDGTDNRLGNLRWGTTAENKQDMIDHGRSTRGEANPRATMTEETVMEIIALRATGARLKDIAERLGVSPGAVQKVTSGTRWSWLTGIGGVAR